jgi:hypothetical protein
LSCKPVPHELATIRHAIGIEAAVLKSIPGFDVQAQSRGQQRITSELVEVPLRSERPFLALAMHWDAQVMHAHQVELAVRGSTDGTDWTEWIGVGIDHHVTLEDGRYAGELVFLPEDIRFVQYQALLTPNLMQTNPRLDQVLLHFINPGVTAEADLAAFRQTAAFPEIAGPLEGVTTNQTPADEGTGIRERVRSGDVNFNVSYALPAYVNRVSWGGTLNLTNTAPRTQTTVNHLIVHHSAGQNTSNDFAAVVRSYYIMHTQTNGWTDIGYNWLIDRNGVLYQGRAFNFNGSPDVVGAHMGGGNSGTMGVCLIGDFTSVQPTEQALLQLRNVLSWKAHERNIDVRVRRTHTLGNLHTISGHRDGTATQCPGNAFYPRLPEIRTRTHAYLNPPQILAASAVVASGSPNEAVIRAEINPRGSAVSGYVAYGLSAAELTSETTDFNLTASETASEIPVTLTNLTPGTRYYYQVIAVNSETVTTSETGSFVAGETTSVETVEEIPLEVALYQNYPNPFNPSTRITYALPEAAHVRIELHNMQGQLMRVLADQTAGAGHHVISVDARGLASGVYLYSLQVNGATRVVRKMTILE